MSNRVQNPYEIFTDVDGTPLEGGYIYIGEEGLNPLSNPQQAYWDADLTIPASNIRTSGGYPVYQGSPGRLYTEDPYSITVRNSRENVVFSSLSPPEDVLNQLQVTDYLEVSSGVFGESTLSGNRIMFDRSGENWIRATSSGGTLAVIVDGRSQDASQASVVFNTDGTVSFPFGIQVDEIAEDTASNGTTLVEAKADGISEATTGEGVSIQAEGAGQLKTKVIDIGEWDMDATSSVTIAHGLSDIETIQGISVEIRKDSDVTQLMRSLFIDTGSGAAGYREVGATNIILYRSAAGVFDTTEYDETTYNRGLITITYEV